MSAPDPEVRERIAGLWKELAEPLRSFFGQRAPAHEVEDLLQETFLRVQQGLSGLRDEERLPGWIQRIARNVWVDALKRRRGALLEDEPAADEAEERLELEVGRWAVQAIRELEPLDRAILERTELEGVPHREVASELGLSLDVVKVRVRRGREKVRRALEECCAFEFDRLGSLQGWRRKDGPSCDC